MLATISLLLDNNILSKSPTQFEHHVSRLDLAIASCPDGRPSESQTLHSSCSYDTAVGPIGVLVTQQNRKVLSGILT